jgi:hypothetical protein
MSSTEAIRMSRRVAGYAAMTGRPVLADALAGAHEEQPRESVADWVSVQALSPSPAARRAGVVERLDRVGIGAVALHRGLYPPETGARLEAGLDALLGPSAVTTHDAGETVTVWVVASGPPPGSADDRVAAWRSIRDEFR